MANEYTNYIANASGITQVDWNSMNFAGSSQRQLQEDSLGFIKGTATALGLTAGSAVVGLANTVPWIANMVGGEGTLRYLETLEFAQKLDEVFDSGQAIEGFYHRHSEGVELSGVLLGSLVPGGLAVKGFRAGVGAIRPMAANMARTNSDHIVGKSASYITGLMATDSKTKLLRQSYQALFSNTNTLSGWKQLDRLRYAGAAAKSLAVEAAVFESAAFLTQSQNPTFENIEDLNSFVRHIGTASLFGAGLGGVGGYFGVKGAKFLPTPDATQYVTWRDTANIIESGRRKAMEVADFAEKIRSVPAGDKLVSLFEDAQLSIEQLRALVSHLAQNTPKSLHDSLDSMVDSWFSTRNRLIDSLIDKQMIALTGAKKTETALGSDIISTLFKDADGKFVGNVEAMARVFGDAKGVARLGFTTTTSKGNVTGINLRDVIQLTEEARSAVDAALKGTQRGTAYAKLREHQAELRELFKSRGVSWRAAREKLPEDLRAQKDAILKVNSWLREDANIALRTIWDDPTKFTSDLARSAGLAKDEIASLEKLIGFEHIQTTKRYFDMVARDFVHKPIPVLGDLVNKVADWKIVGKDLRFGHTTVFTGINKRLANSKIPDDPLVMQMLWTQGEKGFDPKLKDVGKKLWTQKGGWNVWRLAAAIDQDIPIYKGEQLLTKEQALYELSGVKKNIYSRGVSRGMSDGEARLYADIPADVELNASWVGEQGRYNDFMQRRNIVMDYVTDEPLSSFEVKALAGIRSNMLTQQLEAHGVAMEILDSSYRAGLPDSVKDLFERLLRYDLRGVDQVDVAHGASPGLIGNATGRLNTLQMITLRMGALLGDIRRDVTGQIQKDMAGAMQAILKGTNRDAELDILRLIQNKTVGSGTKYYDLAHYAADFPAVATVLAAEAGETGKTFISREIANIMYEARKNAENALAKGEEFVYGPGESPQELIGALIDSGSVGQHFWHSTNKNVNALLDTYTKWEQKIRGDQIKIQGARGNNVIRQLPGELYFPPTDVKANPFFVLVRDLSDVATGGFVRTSFIHAKDEAGLKTKVDLLEKTFGADRYEFLHKLKIADKKILEGEYERALNFYSYNLDTEMASKGIFSEATFRTGQDIMTEMQRHLTEGSTRNLRQVFKDASGNFLDTVTRLGDTIDEFAGSVHGKAFERGRRGGRPDNIYSQLARTFLDIGVDENAKGVLGAVVKATNQLEDWGNTFSEVMRGWRDSVRLAKGRDVAKWEARADKMMFNAKLLGMDIPKMTGPHRAEFLKEIEPSMLQSNAVRSFTRSLNALSVLMTLGLELMNPIVQAVSLPLTLNSAIRQTLADASPEALERLGGVGAHWTGTKLLTKATWDFWKDIPNVSRYDRWRSGRKLSDNAQRKLFAWMDTPAGKDFIELSNGGLLPPSMRNMMLEIGEITDLSSFKNLKGKDMAKAATGMKNKLLRAVELTSAPNRYSEMFQRYAALKVGMGMAKAAGITDTATRDAFMYFYSSQASGVYTAAQRPGLFQGAVGSSLGLYKSYALNVMQALARHIENKDVMGMVGLGAVQGSIYGGRSIPGADYLNRYIMAQSDSGDLDLYTMSDMILGERFGNVMLYGMPSMLLNANLYTRGDLNPNTLAGDPLSIDSYPAWRQMIGGIRAIGNAASDIGAGVGVTTALLNGVAKQSMWRPAQRVAEFAVGAQTSAAGREVQMIDNSPSEILSRAFLARMAGARPYDESVVSDVYYREEERKTKRSKAMSRVNRSLRNQLRAGKEPDYDYLFEQFVNNGGNPTEFRNWIRDRLTESTRDEVEKLRTRLLKNQHARMAQLLDKPAPLLDTTVW